MHKRNDDSERDRQVGKQEALELAVEPTHEPVTPQQDEPDETDAVVAELAASIADVRSITDPLDAELPVSALLGGAAVPEGEFLAILAEQLVPALAGWPSEETLTLLYGIARLAPEPAGSAATAAAASVVAQGIPEPGWSAELAEPVTADDCVEMLDPDGDTVVLGCAFRRAGRGHGLLVRLAPMDCGAAEDAMLLEDGELDVALGQLVEANAADGVALRTRTLEPAALRWKLEAAMDARAVHEDMTGDAESLDAPEDLDDPGDLDDPDDLEDDEGEVPDYAALVPLLRARLRDLPEPAWPAPEHPVDHEQEPDLDAPGQGLGALAEALFAPEPVPELPQARDPAVHGQAPRYQLKVGLHGAKPPIWRRLEVRADTTLSRLHEVVQIAFEWHDAHLHAFDTPYGGFGPEQAELDLRSEAAVTLEQVAPGEGSKLRYEYDFGDDWAHEIVVEQVRDAGSDTRAVRCTGGRRAAPPEDCGGVPGYQQLVDVLTDPEDPDHHELLVWLGLDSSEQFDPSTFDRTGINDRLTQLS